MLHAEALLQDSPTETHWRCMEPSCSEVEDNCEASLPLMDVLPHCQILQGVVKARADLSEVTEPEGKSGCGLEIPHVLLQWDLGKEANILEEIID